MTKDKNTPILSIIIPFFNTGTSLIGLLKQIKKTCHVSYEIICIDDKSTDDSLKKIQKAAKDDKNISVITQKKNCGSAAARNKGLELAKGKYIIFIDSDDFIRDDYFDKMLDSINEDKNITLCACGIRQIFLKTNKVVDKFIKPQYERQKDDSFKEYILRSMIKDAALYSSVNKIYRSDIIKLHTIRFDESLDFAEDTKFVLDYLCYFEDDAKINYILEPLYFYNYGTTTSVVSNSSLPWSNWEKSYKNILAWLGKDYDGSERVISRREYKCAKKLRQRFKISHALAVARSKKPREEKLKYAGKFELFAAEIIEKIRK